MRQTWYHFIVIVLITSPYSIFLLTAGFKDPFEAVCYGIIQPNIVKKIVNNYQQIVAATNQHFRHSSEAILIYVTSLTN